MPNFNYLAQDNHGKQVRGSLEAANFNEAKLKLKQTGFYIIWIRQESRLAEALGFSKVRNMDLAVFSHQFSAMISSGIPLIRALIALAEETTNKTFRTIINKIRYDVENGSSLSDSLSKHPKVFSNFFVSLIKTGEAGGVLPTVLSRLASYLEKEEDLRRKVRSSFAYPVIVGIVAIGVVAFLLIFIVPVFRTAYKSLRIDLPGPTVFLIFLSNVAVKFWWLVLMLVVTLYVLFKMARQDIKFSLLWDEFKLKIPIFGQLNKKVAVSRFVRTLSTLMGSGLTLGQSLPIVKEVVGNQAVAEGIENLKKDIIQGKQISESLKGQNIFPAIVTQMVSVGEESGSLNNMLDKCADFLDEDIDTLIKGLVVKLEPILTFGLALLVGFIALAIYLPMFDLIKQINK